MQSEESQFEEPIIKLRRRLEELEALPDDGSRRREIQKLRERIERTTEEIYANLSPWQKTLVARHPQRPYPLDYIQALTRDFVEIHGDRRFSDDEAIVAGLAVFGDRPIAVIGHQKGRDTKEKIRRNFGMPRPDGYRKALRVMKLAEKFRKGKAFDLDDFKAQLAQMKKMGGLASLADKLPVQLTQMAQTSPDLQEKALRRTEGIINAMTPLERRKPELLKASRKRRIAAGAGVQLLAREGEYAQLRMRSGEIRRVHVNCKATVGEVGNEEHNLRQIGKAGANRWRGIRPTVRGETMNPVDHPLGGRTRGNRHPVSPWGQPAKGKKTRNNKRTQTMIVRSRHKKA